MEAQKAADEVIKIHMEEMQEAAALEIEQLAEAEAINDLVQPTEEQSIQENQEMNDESNQE